MYGFPEIDALKPLIGKTLVQISCNANQVIFEFDDRMRITCEKGLKLSAKGRMVDVNVPMDNLGLLDLLESKIVAISGEGKTCLVLNFSNGSKILLIDDDKYESYKLDIGKKEFLV